MSGMVKANYDNSQSIIFKVPKSQFDTLEELSVFELVANNSTI